MPQPLTLSELLLGIVILILLATLLQLRRQGRTLQAIERAVAPPILPYARPSICTAPEWRLYAALTAVARERELAVLPRVPLHQIFMTPAGAAPPPHVTCLLVSRRHARPVAGVLLTPPGRRFPDGARRLRQAFQAARLPLLLLDGGADEQTLRRQLNVLLPSPAALPPPETG
jgi:hypothetical protein